MFQESGGLGFCVLRCFLTTDRFAHNFLFDSWGNLSTTGQTKALEIKSLGIQGSFGVVRMYQHLEGLSYHFVVFFFRRHRTFAHNFVFMVWEI